MWTLLDAVGDGAGAGGGDGVAAACPRPLAGGRGHHARHGGPGHHQGAAGLAEEHRRIGPDEIGQAFREAR